MKADERLLASHHNQALTGEAKNDGDQKAMVEIEETELEAITVALRVRTRPKDSLQPCL